MSDSYEVRFGVDKAQGRDGINDEISEPIEIENSVHVETLTKNEEPIEKKEVAIKPEEPKEKVRIDPVQQTFTEIVVWAMYNDIAVSDLARSNLKRYEGLSSATQTLKLRVEELSVLSDLAGAKNMSEAMAKSVPNDWLQRGYGIVSFKVDYVHLSAFEDEIPGVLVERDNHSRNLKDNENENDLPKLYSLTMTIQNMEVDMLSIGVVYSVTLLDFVPPPCPEADVEVADESDDEDTESL
ncbi:hypothetical protein BHYA_0108g00040 [Botrytis hyacinthi]|uniref:Uncharacterized protein n=1 Tax=Botrytis hyacinthi TaxID=278943 RepID=A0A4Z1GL60_9HELO|nr:hypothetical protein BHYA_0108g00040 [Botrytis hyacinthi]